MNGDLTPALSTQMSGPTTWWAAAGSDRDVPFVTIGAALAHS